MSIDDVDFEAIVKVLANRHVASRYDFIKEIANFLFGSVNLDWNSPEEKKCNQVMEVLVDLGYFKKFSHGDHMIFKDVGKI